MGKLFLRGKAVENHDQLCEMYREEVKLHGFTHSSMFYSTPEQHIIKLSSLARLVSISLSEQGAEELVDIGCGYGELLNYLKVPQSVAYTGLDISPEMISAARLAHPWARFVLVNQNIQSFLCKQGCICMCGVLNSTPDPYELLESTLSGSTKTVIFDVVIEGRLPPSFSDLNRFRDQDITNFIESNGYHISSRLDAGHCWVGYTCTPKVFAK